MRFRKFWRGARFVAPLVGLALTACLGPPVESPKTTVVQVSPLRVAQNNKNKVDVLFMVDNSPSMQPMVDELQNRFGDFFQVFQDLAAKGTYADLHIGVVTSDYGAGATGVPGGGCQASPGGQKGILQQKGACAEPATGCGINGAGLDPGCQGPAGAKFISYQFGPNGTSNLPPGESGVGGLIDTFKCMAAVGAQGCGFEHQLESVYAALHNTTDNAGFLRDDALLTVVFVTNEDDGSAPPTVQFFGAPSDTGAMFGHLDTYRQTHFGVACGGPPPALTPDGQLTPAHVTLTGCQAAANVMGNMVGQEYDVSRYVNFLTLPSGKGGIKVDPSDVILVGIDAPPVNPGQIDVLMADPGSKATYPVYQPCTTESIDQSSPCVPVLQHSCINSGQHGFFGDPAIRINTVIASAMNHQISSICGTDPNAKVDGNGTQQVGVAPNYQAAMQQLGQLIAVNIGTGCIPAPLSPSVDNPDCTVEDVTQEADGTTKISEIPRCDLAGGAFPCWKVEMKAQCATLSPQGVGVTIDRNGMDAPANTTARVACATIAG